MSSAYLNDVYSNGSEIAFAKQIITHLTSLDSRITCSSDPDDEYDQSEHGDTYVPTLNFKINNELAFTIKRSGALNNTAYQFQYICDSTSQVLNFQGNAYRHWVEAFRHIAISHIVTDNFIYIEINGYFSNGGVTPARFAVAYVSQSNKMYFSAAAGTSDPVSKATVFNISEFMFRELVDGNGAQGTFVSRFPYNAAAGEIDYVKSAVYCFQDVKQFDLKSVYDCTTVTPGSSVSLKDGSYIAVGPHQLVKVS